MKTEKDFSYQCPCGVVHPMNDPWTAAHFDEVLMHKCPACHRVNNIKSGRVIGEKEPRKRSRVTTP
jgi:phage FluMu protein Com